MVIVSREPDGRWYVTFTLDTAAPEPLERTGRAVGVGSSRVRPAVKQESRPARAGIPVLQGGE